jgi:small-conductance mechanosensitive channel
MLTVTPAAFVSVLALQDSIGVLARTWQYLNHPYQIGSLEVSVTKLAQGVLILAIALLLSRTLSRLLQRRIAKRAYLDPGLRYTLGRLTQYVMVTLGVLLALKVAFTLDLTSIAVIFTALSVGIGFGLQYLAADVASGFILLFERPVRVGDRITIGEDEGDVQSINLRTTVVTTNDRISIIVPNSRLVSQRLINWSYGDPRARISIHVGVATDSDVELVTQTLLKAAEGVDNVLNDPSPKVSSRSSAIIVDCLQCGPIVHGSTRRFGVTSTIAPSGRFAKRASKFLFQTEGLRDSALHLDAGDKFIADDRSPHD